MSKGKILFVLSSHDRLLNGKPTGWYLPEAAHPFYVLSPHYTVDFASPKGGKAPLDPSSVEQFANDEGCKQFLADPVAQKGVNNTLKLEDVKEGDYLAIFYVGGHGPVFDLARDSVSKKLIQDFWEAKKPVSAVCHGPCVFIEARDKKGDLIVKGRRVTCFTNEEEEMVKLVDAMPYLVETRLRESGAEFVKPEKPWASQVIVDGHLITGANPASAEGTGHAILKALQS
eukprot:TRINITY_DN1917_c0_g1_i1.p1 TRINITY_DN1917_c0_g1~~TRINITY_DN1917_c0_g1_i1.p1  ORF type:complete len:229 (-),score=59.13 TRINITY_DN1917_c0_g1_i1:76-762(-)